MKNIKLPLLCALASGIFVAFGTGAIKITSFPFLSSPISKIAAYFPFISRESDWRGTYIAAYLENGKVYFGKLEEQDNQQFSITEVFFLRTQKVTQSPKENNSDNDVQVEDQSASGMEFELVRLADQFYAPEDRLVITSDQLLFWEPLAENSKVIEAIKKYKGE